MHTIKKVSWREVNELSISVSRMVTADGFQPDIILAIARGGLIPATIIASKIGVKDIISLGVRAYNKDKQRLETPELLHSFPPKIVRDKKVLVVDELVDSGATLIFLRSLLESEKMYCDVRFAVLHRKTCSKFKPDYFAQAIHKNEWLQYAWESKE